MTAAVVPAKFGNDLGLKIETFDNQLGGISFFKAIGHPLVKPKVDDLLSKLSNFAKIAVFDPHGFMSSFAELHDCSSLPQFNVYVQKFEHLDRKVLGRQVKPVTMITDDEYDAILIAAFDSDRVLGQIDHLLNTKTQVFTFDDIRIPSEMLSVPKRYLDPLNFATNLAFFREQNGLHTRIITANYWSGYNGGKSTVFHLTLFDDQGCLLAQWQQEFTKQYQTVVIDSQEIRERFNLPEFCGQLFMHISGAAGHDVVKYALDVFDDDGKTFTCSHDANAWPADSYAGMPAPRKGEEVVLWVQNSHSRPIPAGGVGLSLMGSSNIAWYGAEIPSFAMVALKTRDLLPDAKWPQQFEIHAGKYFVRPRYEIINPVKQRRWMGHANVQRIDLQDDPKIRELEPLFGKSYILPAPILPRQRWHTTMLPTPMSTAQSELPIAAVLFNEKGQEIARHSFGKLQRSDSVALEIEQLLADSDIDYGHIEMIYDFANGGYADGWLHSIFRYRDHHNDHTAETSFGAHMFNTLLTYKNEPQSYAGPAPGLSTRLFLRVGTDQLDTMCHLIYTASTPWREMSSTKLILHSDSGEGIATREIQIPCNGSRYWTYHEMFTEEERAQAGQHPYVIIRDTTCRLFGYHGLLDGDRAFSLDHMFGF